MNYYRILDNLEIKKRWFLGEINFPEEGDFWNYVMATIIKEPPSNLKVRVKVKGKKLDFTFGQFEVIVVNQKVADLFNDKEVQKIPIQIEGESESYFIIITKNEIDAVDREKSIYELWEKDNTIRPDLAGGFCVIMKMIVDPFKIKDITITIFRLKYYGVAVIVSEKFKNNFERLNLKGIEFKKV